MRPDNYIRFRPGDFFPAVAGQPSHIKWGYWNAIVHYRCHNHCRGLEDNDDFLRRLCEIEKDQWEHAKQIIFDNDQFFTLDENGLWHQKCAFMDYAEDLESYNRAVRRSEIGNQQRWGKKRKKK